MGGEELFEDLPEQAAPEREAALGAPRLREPVRDQIELRAVDLDALLSQDHPARLIWAYVEKLDVRVLEDCIMAREGRPGHPPASPRLLLALWLYATCQGVGSARALAKLCDSEDAFRWLCGGVSVNYHGLADFRTAYPELLDELLAQNVAALARAGVVDLDTLAQDGLRVRASAGGSSFRRRKSLHDCLERARAAIARLKQELDADPGACDRRVRAARERAAREREARVTAAIERLAELEAERTRRARTNKKETERQKEPRASTTDAQARVMKMSDGGYRPAYNLQIASACEQQIITAVSVDSSGSDRGLMQPMLEELHRRYDRWPARYLVDGGFAKKADIEWAAARDPGIAVHCPPTVSKHNTDPYARRPKDGPGVAAWRVRMASAEGKALAQRRSLAECIHARFRHWGLYQLTVRGVAKARTVLLWFALANNILQGHRLIHPA
jgi:transposase